MSRKLLVWSHVVTFSRLYVGISLLSPNLHPDGSPLPMAGAPAGQVRPSVAKPLKRTPWASPGRPPTAPGWAFAACAAVPAAAYLLGECVVGQAIPALSTVVVLGYPVARAARRQPTLIRLP